MRFSPDFGASRGLAVILALAWAAPAGAVPSVDLYFVGKNGSPIADATTLAVAPGDQIDVEMRIASDERGVTAYSISVDYDSAGQGRILLEDFADTLPDGFDFALGATTPWGPGDPNGTPGFVRHFTAGTFEPDPVTESAVFAIATLSFSVTSAILDGPALIAPGLFFVGIDEIISNEWVLVGEDFVFEDVSAEYALHDATLVAIPEPSTALLLGGALVGLSAWRRGCARRADPR